MNDKELNARDTLSPIYNDLVNALDTLNDKELLTKIKEEMKAHVSKIRATLERNTTNQGNETVGLIDDKYKKKARVFNTHHM